MSAYRLSAPYEESSLQRRGSSFALALAVNLLVVLVLLTLGDVAPVVRNATQAVIVDMLPESHSQQTAATRAAAHRQTRPPVKRPPIVIPSKPTIAAPPLAPDKRTPWIEVSKEDMAASDVGTQAKNSDGSSGDSEVVGTGPHGETLYAAEWARHPTNAELGGYLPADAPDGYGLVACKTVPGDRVEDCVEIDQEPHGSHLASAVRQAAWQFRIRPPRKNGVPLIGSWVSIRIDYDTIRRDRL